MKNFLYLAALAFSMLGAPMAHAQNVALLSCEVDYDYAADGSSKALKFRADSGSEGKEASIRAELLILGHQLKLFATADIPTRGFNLYVLDQPSDKRILIDEFQYQPGATLSGGADLGDKNGEKSFDVHCQVIEN